MAASAPMAAAESSKGGGTMLDFNRRADARVRARPFTVLLLTPMLTVMAVTPTASAQEAPIDQLVTISVESTPPLKPTSSRSRSPRPNSKRRHCASQFSSNGVRVSEILRHPLVKLP